MKHMIWLVIFLAMLAFRVNPGIMIIVSLIVTIIFLATSEGDRV